MSLDGKILDTKILDNSKTAMPISTQPSAIHPPGKPSYRYLHRLWYLAGACLLFTLLLQRPALAQSNIPFDSAIVISEIHYNPEQPTERIEFVELYNRGSGAVSLNSWQLDGAIEYKFALGTIIPAGGYLVIAEDPIAIQARYGIVAHGAYTGKLANEGDDVLLRNSLADIVDAVRYQPAFPWPVVGDPPGPSIQLLNPNLDNALGGAWHRAVPTPGQRNSVHTANAAPHIDGVEHAPHSPRSGESVEIVARVIDPDGIRRVAVHYQVVAPGNYIRRHDPAYGSQWSVLPMEHDGDDANLYRMEMPQSVQVHRRLIRYRIEAVDLLGASELAPVRDSVTPNFAYFVYDAVPPFQASIDGGPVGIQSFDFTQMRPLPIYHLIATQADVADALFIPPSAISEGYVGNEYPWFGTLVYNGKVYDHITFRARGGSTRYATGKNMMKFNFNRGHRFQAVDDYGRAYDVKWDKLNLSAVIQQSHRRHRGEQGLFESLGFRLFNSADVEASLTHFVHVRVIDDASENGTNQYEGDFWGLYLAIEQLDGNFLKQHDLADGNLYKMENWTGELNNQGPFAATDKSDLNYFTHTYTAFRPPMEWWRATLDLERYYSYRSIVEAIHHYDIGDGKNYFYFLNPQTNRWSVHPWDLDLTWAAGMPGDGAEPIADRLLHGDLKLEYRNRLRELRDLLFNQEQMNQMIDEHARIINTSANGLNMVDADRAKWDYNPVFESRYIVPKRTVKGDFYSIAEDHTFEGMVDLVKRWVRDRSAWIDANLTADDAHPHTPTIGYIGAPAFPPDNLRFTTSDFSDPQGGHTFKAMEWRLAEVTDPNADNFDPNAPVLYEINALSESGEIDLFVRQWSPPAGIAQPGHTYRARVRMQDKTGRWSHWSAPLQFQAGNPSTPPITTIRISELMYNAPNTDGVAGEYLEYIELTNIGTEAVDLSSARFAAGIEYTFPLNTVLAPNAYLVLAGRHDPFVTIYAFEPFDLFEKRLSNGGEEVVLQDAYGRTVTAVTYDDTEPWPQGADGDGYSLVWETGTGNGSDGWRRSTALRGSPGIADPLPVLINEILADPGTGQQAYVELYNPGSRPADIRFWYLTDGSESTNRYQFGPNSVVPADGYLVVDASVLDNSSESLLHLDRHGQTLILHSATENDRTTGYRHSFRLGAPEQGVALGRYTTTDGREIFWPQQRNTRGEENSDPRVGPVVISEIMYHPNSGEEYVELTNISESTIDLFDHKFPQHTWRLDGIAYSFPPGISLQPQQKIILVTGSPTRICVDYELPPNTQVLGPYTVALGDDGHDLHLLRPGSPRQADEEPPYYPVDRVSFSDDPPWPVAAAGNGSALVRMPLTAWGFEPSNWQAGNTNPLIRGAQLNTTSAMLCSFELRTNMDDQRAELYWVTRQELNVVGYNVWHSINGDRQSAQRIVAEIVRAQAAAEGSTQYMVEVPNSSATSVFWLEAIGPDGQVVEVGRTQPSKPLSTIFLPVVGGR